jgi:riboflavin-specific deaminase-like protein
MRRLLPEPGEATAEELYLVERPVPDGRPWVLANMVCSLDGAAAADGVTEPLSGPADKRVFGLLRSAADVILVGAGTVRAEGYGPAKINDQRRAERKGRGQEPVPPIAVVTASLQLDWLSRFFTEAEARPLVVTMAGSAPERREHAATVADVVVAGDDRVDLAAALGDLRDRGHRVLLTEGGPSLLGELVAADVLDELCLTIAPVVLGGETMRIVSGPAVAPAGFEVATLATEDGFLFLRCLRKR